MRTHHGHRPVVGVVRMANVDRSHLHTGHIAEVVMQVRQEMGVAFDTEDRHIGNFAPRTISRPSRQCWRRCRQPTHLV